MPVQTANASAPRPKTDAERRAARKARAPVRRAGRPAIDRDDVAEIQRVRILGAMSELVRERGGADVTVAHIVARSGISRRTFYEHFGDREECFLVAFDRAVRRAAESVAVAYEGTGNWRERTRAALTAILAYLDAEPDQAYLCVVGALGSGPHALQRRTAVLRTLVAAVQEGGAAARRRSRSEDHERSSNGSEPRAERLVAEGVVGAVLAVIQARMLERDPDPLLSLLNPLMGMIVLPYLGPAAAQRELTRAAPRAAHPPRPQSNPLRELDMRLTYRTVRVLRAIAAHPGASNREVSAAAGISDQGQISKLLARLQKLGLVCKEGQAGEGFTKGEPNAWTLTDTGRQLAETVRTADAEG